MTTPMVERVRTIPLLMSMTVDDDDDYDSGFPFDREGGDRRDESFRSQLDDIAKRHPEFAEHLGGFPFRGDSSGGSARPQHRQENSKDFRRFDSPFGFERFGGFPFDRDEFFEEPQQPPQSQSQEKTQTHQEPPQQPSTGDTDLPEEAPQRGRKQPNIQPSNTVDLGQKQEPVNERNQRSMSAPPDNRQRFVSSINIPISRNEAPPQETSYHQQEMPQSHLKSTERVIPIHVEGRDEPVLPKHPGPAFSNQQQPPEPERVYFGCGPFGSRPVPPPQPGSGRSPRGFGDPRAKPQYQQPPQYQPPPQPQKFQEQQAAPPPQQTHSETVPPPQPAGPIELIKKIQQDVSALMCQVENFTGQPRDKQYLYLDEMLTRNLIKLDNIDTEGQENIRSARKEAIKCIERCIGALEAKAAANVPQATQQGDSEFEKMEQVIDDKQQEEIKMDVDDLTGKSDVIVGSDRQKMDELAPVEPSKADVSQSTTTIELPVPPPLSSPQPVDNKKEEESSKDDEKKGQNQK